jgi:outer membrane biosynthesis protein TonB
MQSTAHNHEAFLSENIKILYSQEKKARPGQVEYKILIDSRGRVTSVVPYSADNLGKKVNAQVASLVSLLLWEPATVNGQQVAVWLPYSVGVKVAPDEFKSVTVEVPENLYSPIEPYVSNQPKLDVQAQPKGGIEEAMQTLVNNLRYPREAQQFNVQGAVYSIVTINERGEVEEIKALPGKKLGYGLEEEAHRVIKILNWEPAQLNGEPVTSSLIYPIRFRLAR